jgi:hypothetical protein
MFGLGRRLSRLMVALPVVTVTKRLRPKLAIC